MHCKPLLKTAYLCIHPAGHFTLEYGDQRGMQALSGTYEGARAASGSNSAFNLARRDSIGGSVFTSDNDAYGPTPGRPTLVKNGERRSVAFTDLPPNSAAQSGTGYGVVAASAGGCMSAWVWVWVRVGRCFVSQEGDWLC